MDVMDVFCLAPTEQERYHKNSFPQICLHFASFQSLDPVNNRARHSTRGRLISSNLDTFKASCRSEYYKCSETKR